MPAEGRENPLLKKGNSDAFFREKYLTKNTDVMVIDPPRKGCQPQVLDTMVKMAPERIVYVSCDSATLARDLKYLCQRGYELKRFRAADMFPMSVHVETVALLTRDIV